MAPLPFGIHIKYSISPSPDVVVVDVESAVVVEPVVVGLDVVVAVVVADVVSPCIVYKKLSGLNV